MPNDDLDARLENVLKEHKKTQKQERAKMEASMWERLRREERCQELVIELFRSVVRPPLERLVAHFVDAYLECSESDHSITVYLGRDPRRGVDAHVQFIVNYRRDAEDVTLHYKLSSAPGASEFWADLSHDVSIANPDMEAAARFVEDSVVRAAEAYLEKQRTPPPSHQSTPVTDLVCGMRFPREGAACSLEHLGKTHFFCAQVCKSAFQDEPGRYLQQRS
jgi:YHS domain-containing protein